MKILFKPIDSSIWIRLIAAGFLAKVPIHAAAVAFGEFRGSFLELNDFVYFGVFATLFLVIGHFTRRMAWSVMAGVALGLWLSVPHVVSDIVRFGFGPTAGRPANAIFLILLNGGVVPMAWLLFHLTRPRTEGQVSGSLPVSRPEANPRA